MKNILIIVISFFLFAVFPVNKSAASSEKITFDISQISPEGLIGPPGGLRSLSYEFCIPAQDQFIEEVKSIDPNITIFPQSRGRIGCNSEQYLCLNDTHNPRWQEILFSLASLDFIEKIDRFYGE
jgi:hypothetical protein